MSFRLNLSLALACALFVPTSALGGEKHGFANKEGGGANDPVIEVAASIAPDVGATFSLTPDQANALYKFNPMNLAFEVTQTPPLIPQTAGGRNQFIAIRFPFKISSKSATKSIMKNKPELAADSFLTGGISFKDDTGASVKGIATIAGKDVFGTNLKKDPAFPSWDDAKGKNQLVKNSVFTFIADEGDQNLSTPAAFGSAPGDPDTSLIGEVRVTVAKVDGVLINGFWVLKVDPGTGLPQPGITPKVNDIIALNPVSPPKTNLGNPVVEAFSKYRLLFSEPMIPWSVGFGSDAVKDFNSTNPPFPLSYNGNSSFVPNYDPTNLGVPLFPNLRVQAYAANGVAGFVVPFDLRPINPNNLAEYVINPILDLPGKTDVDVTVLPRSSNQNFVVALGANLGTSATTLYNLGFDEAGVADNTRRFHTGAGRAFTNVPVSPGVLYYVPLFGNGIGAINLDGNGLETNDPATSRLIILTNNTVMCTCPTAVTSLPNFAGSHLLGCNGNTFGIGGGTVPIGIAGNPPGTHLGPSTPVPGVNEGSDGTTANVSPFSTFPLGFETVVKNSEGNPRLADLPDLGGVIDGEVGEFLDTLFFDHQNLGTLNALHQSAQTGTTGPGNFISDPPVPNPPPLRLPVGLQPVDIVFGQQKLLKPAFVIEGDEVWPTLVGCGGIGPERVLLLPNPINPLTGDILPRYPQSGPFFQTFNAAGIYASRQQIGNFLYVTDRDFGTLSVLNSNTMTVIDRIELPDPTGIGVAPDLRHVYVSNFADNSLSVIAADPFAANFHKEIARLSVGEGPISVSAQPNGEDVAVCNYNGNSVSFLDTASLTIRNTVSGSMKRPFDVVLTPRLGLLGWASGIYLGYIASQGSGDLLIYESGPSGASGFGADEMKWAASQTSRFEQMRHLAYDPMDYPGISTNDSPFAVPTLPNQLVSGVWVTHQDEQTGLAMVTRVAFTRQLPMPGALPNVPLPGSILSSPGVVQRIFEPVQFIGGPLVPFNQQLNPGGQDQTPYDIAFSDVSVGNFFNSIPTVAFNGFTWKTNGGSVPPPIATSQSRNHKYPARSDAVGNPVPVYIPDRMYVSFPGDNRIVVLSPNGGNNAGPLNVINGAMAPGKLIQFFDL